MAARGPHHARREHRLRAEIGAAYSGLERPIWYTVSGVSPGELLRTVRRRHGLTQQQLAMRARTSQAAISRIERDLVSPSVATLATLLDLMGEKLVLDAEPIEYGYDRTLIRENLAHDPATRIARQASWSRGLQEIRRAAGR